MAKLTAKHLFNSNSNTVLVSKARQNSLVRHTQNYQ